MFLIKRFLDSALFWLTGNMPCKLIYRGDKPYLERYYLGSILGVTFYLHRFVSADKERDIHNHPWGWGGSLILLGSYIEERCLDICPFFMGSGCLTTRRKIRFFNRVDGNSFHRISDAEKITWTFFFHGKRSIILPGAQVSGMPFPVIYKGWGFFEQEFFGGEKVTVFRSYDSPSALNWWATAKKGIEIGRESRVR